MKGLLNLNKEILINLMLKDLDLVIWIFLRANNLLLVIMLLDKDIKVRDF